MSAGLGPGKALIARIKREEVLSPQPLNLVDIRALFEVTGQLLVFESTLVFDVHIDVDRPAV